MRQVWYFVALVAVLVPAVLYSLFEWLLLPVSASPRRELVVIKPGTGVAAMAHQLKAQRLIRDEATFRLYVRLTSLDHGIKAGAYALAPNMDARTIADALASGKGVSLRVTVPEGFSLRQIAASLDRQTPGSGQRFTLLTKHAAYFRPNFAWLGGLPAGASLEGFVFPDTYVVAPGPDAEHDLVEMMLQRFAQVALPAYQAGHGTLTLTQAVTMASIVEKEARRPEERPLIAGVFYNRLAQRIPFGSDPTVEYALNRHQDARGLTFKDVKVDSPYNTYVHPGLPPGPIANPGLASLKAALAPAETPYVYFVARGDGSHAFTRTYAEHLAAQRAILAGRK